jgi:hypothetical protein
LISVFNPSQLRIQVQVPERIADALRRNPEAEILLADGSALPAERVLVYPSADADSHSVTVRLQLPDSGKSLKPGQVAKVVFASAAEKASLWSPETAVWRRGELSDGALRLRQLRLGESRDGRIEVLSGVNAGERIAADPAQAALALAAFRAKQARSDGD